MIKIPAQITPAAVRVVVKAATVEASRPALVAAVAAKKAAGMKVFMGMLHHQELLRVQTEAQHCI